MVEQEKAARSKQPYFEGLPKNLELLEKMGEYVDYQIAAQISWARRTDLVLSASQWRLLLRTQGLGSSSTEESSRQMCAQVRIEQLPGKRSFSPRPLSLLPLLRPLSDELKDMSSLCALLFLHFREFFTASKLKS